MDYFFIQLFNLILQFTRILMMENQMKRVDLVRAAELSPYVARKINKDETVSLEVLMRICKVFHCDIGDICEVILDE